jgi:hypothetical protein
MSQIYKPALLFLVALGGNSGNASGQQQTLKVESTNSMMSSTVEWYNPPSGLCNIWRGEPS